MAKQYSISKAECDLLARMLYFGGELDVHRSLDIANGLVSKGFISLSTTQKAKVVESKWRLINQIVDSYNG